MKLGKIGGYIGAGLLAVSCNTHTPKNVYDRAERLAAKNLKGTELITIQKNAPDRLIPNASERIFYWDSLLAANKFKEGIKKGKAFVADSLAGKDVKRPKFNPTNVSAEYKDPNTIIANTQKEVSKYVSGDEMLKLQKAQPAMCPRGFGNLKSHYYGQVAAKAAEREGFEQGVASAKFEKGIK